MKTDRPLLTIAIPTYNRAEFLRELLASLEGQLPAFPNVELLISDNASPDGTADVVEEFSRRGLAMRYLRNETNIGPDPNFLQCYEQAAGRYAWIIGDDDVILDGGLATVVAILEEQSPDYVFVAPYVFHNSIGEIRARNRLAPTRLISDPVEMATLANLHADLILISAAIVDKDRIESLPHPPFSSLVETNLVQLGWVLTALRNLRRGVFVQLGVLAARVGNSRGGFHAAMVFGGNYQRAIVEILETDSKLSHQLIADHMRIWFPRNWLQFRIKGVEAKTQNEVFYRAFHANIWYWICAWPLIHAPEFFARLWVKVLWVAVRLRIERLSTLRVHDGGESVSPMRSQEVQPKPRVRIAAVVVLYFPDLKLLGRLLESIGPQVDHTVLVDNTPSPNADLAGFLASYQDRITYLPLGENTGIAAAQNVGINAVSGKDFSHVLLLDQDSCPNPNMVDALVRAETGLIQAGIEVAAVGPKFIDEKTGSPSKAIRHRWMHVEKIAVDETQTAPVEADYIIASGSLIRLPVLSKVGGMREELFIDCVDIEWGLRARAACCRCYIVPDAIMAHSIGDSFVRVLDKDINLHNDTRNYYIVRNATYLLSEKSMGWRWRSVTFLKIPLYVVFYSWHSSKRLKSFGLLCNAVSDGIRRKVGRLN